MQQNLEEKNQREKAKLKKEVGYIYFYKKKNEDFFI